MKTSTTRSKKLFAAIIWILIWQLASVIINESLFLPSPSQTLAALFELAKTATFYMSVLATLLRVLTGLLITIVLGISLGIASAKYSWLNTFLEPAVSTMKSVPVVTFILLIILYTNSTFVPVVVSVLLCFPVMYINTQKGMLSIDKKLIEMATLHKVSNTKILTHIKIPSILHYILSAIMICIGFSWKSVVTAEVLSAPLQSMGYNLYTSKIYLDTQSIFAWTLVIVLLSIAIEKIAHKLYEKSKWYIGI